MHAKHNVWLKARKRCLLTTFGVVIRRITVSRPRPCCTAIALALAAAVFAFPLPLPVAVAA